MNMAQASRVICRKYRVRRRAWSALHATAIIRPEPFEDNYFAIVTVAVGAILIASPVCGVTTTSSIDTVA